MTANEAVMIIRALPEAIWEELCDDENAAMNLAIEALEGKAEIEDRMTDADLREIVDGIIREDENVQRMAAPHCEYCIEVDGSVKPIETDSCYAFIHDNILTLKTKGWQGNIKLFFCPMCGRKLYMSDLTTGSTTEDAMGRQAVLDINENHHGHMPNHINYQIWQEIKALPSVELERKTGHWIDNSPISWLCSCCKYQVQRYNNTEYCPRCGAEIDGGE